MIYKGILASSSDPTGQTFSQTIGGLVTVLSAIIPLFALQFFHVAISANDVASLVTEAGAVIGSIITIHGLIMKMIHAWGTAPTSGSVAYNYRD